MWHVAFSSLHQIISVCLLSCALFDVVIPRHGLFVCSRLCPLLGCRYVWCCHVVCNRSILAVAVLSSVIALPCLSLCCQVSLRRRSKDGTLGPALFGTVGSMCCANGWCCVCHCLLCAVLHFIGLARHWVMPCSSKRHDRAGCGYPKYSYPNPVGCGAID